MQLVIKYGCRDARREYLSYPTVSDIKHDASLKRELGFGDNIKVMVNSVQQPDHVQLPGPLVEIETAANEKNCQ